MASLHESFVKMQEEESLNEYIRAVHKRLDEPFPRGIKYDKDKPRWNLLPWDELEDVVHVLTFGAKKYAPDNWKFVDDANSRYMDATMRHLVAHQQGEQRDSESGESHIAHAMCCLLFMLWHDKNDNAS